LTLYLPHRLFGGSALLTLPTLTGLTSFPIADVGENGFRYDKIKAPTRPDRPRIAESMASGNCFA